jgi:hypothetical protein
MYTELFYFHFDGIDAAANWRHKVGDLSCAKTRGRH